MNKHTLPCNAEQLRFIADFVTTIQAECVDKTTSLDELVALWKLGSQFFTASVPTGHVPAAASLVFSADVPREQRRQFLSLISPDGEVGNDGK